jgi:hypothetical protein
MATTALNRKMTVFTRKFDLNLRKNLVKCFTMNVVWYLAETSIINLLECFEVWCRRRFEKIGRVDGVENEVLPRDKEERKILRTIKRRKANLIISSCS